MFTMKCIALFLCYLTLCLAEDPPLPRFTINLDLPPEERWVNVSKKYAGYSNEIRKVMDSWFPSKWTPLIMKVIGDFEPHIPKHYALEMVGIANGMNMTTTEVLAFNLMYEILDHCTSVVAQDIDGNIIHARNLDAIFLPSLWRALAVDIDFTQSGKVLYKGTTTVGRIGIITGVRPGAFSLSGNARKHGKAWMTTIMALSGKGNMPSLVARDILEKVTSFTDAVMAVNETYTDAPGYVIIGGVNPGEGAVITKGRLETADIWFMNETKPGWFLVQTNYDHWVPPPARDDRRHPAIKAMHMIGQNGISYETLYMVLSVAPVYNNHTVYTTIMHAKEPHVYQSFRRKR